MVVGTPSINISQQLVGGPKLVAGSVTYGNTDTAINIDLSAFLQKIDAVICLFAHKDAGGALTLTKVDILSDPKILAVTATDPTAASTLHFACVGW